MDSNEEKAERGEFIKWWFDTEANFVDEGLPRLKGILKQLDPYRSELLIKLYCDECAAFAKEVEQIVETIGSDKCDIDVSNVNAVLYHPRYWLSKSLKDIVASGDKICTLARSTNRSLTHFVMPIDKARGELRGKRTLMSIAWMLALHRRDFPRVTLKTLIVPGKECSEGILVDAVSTVWLEIVNHIKQDSEFLFQLDWRQLEELVAGAYRQSGWDVILTPRRGDRGIDIVATRSDIGQLRFIDQCKAYAPDHRVGVAEIREMAGVLYREPNTTKAIITTTSEFTEGAKKEFSDLMPYRLELKPRAALVTWLQGIVGEGPRS